MAKTLAIIMRVKDDDSYVLIKNIDIVGQDRYLSDKQLGLSNYKMDPEKDVWYEIDPSWVMTDPDSLQCVRRAKERGDRAYECIQICEIADQFAVSHAFIYLDDYSANDVQEILHVYDIDGYPSDQLLAEMFFETDALESISVPCQTWKDAAEYLGETVSVPVEQITDWESIFRSFFDSVTAATHGKVQYFDQGNGTWYSRISGEYLSLKGALKEYVDAVRE